MCVQAAWDLSDLELLRLEPRQLCLLTADFGASALGLVEALDASRAQPGAAALAAPEPFLRLAVSTLQTLGAACTEAERMRARNAAGAAQGGLTAAEALASLAAAAGGGSGVATGGLAVRVRFGFVAGPNGAASTARRLLARASGRGKSQTAAGTVDAVRTADVTREGWDARDASIRSERLSRAPPPPRRVGAGNALLGGVLLRQVRC